MMKRVLFIIALLCLGVVACKKTEMAQSVNANSAPGVINTSDKTENRAATGQTDNAAPQVKNRLPPPTGHVNDYADAIDDETKMRLEKTLGDLKQRSAIEFAIAIVKTTEGEDIFNYSLAVAREWAVGAKPSGDGLLLLVAVEDRKWHIQVSGSLEDELPDEKVGELGRVMVEPFRAGKYGEGLTKCVKAIIAQLNKQRSVKSKGRKKV
ncbi:MAG TPA: TPM domain-containing protein [Pyrinomonadaceae bacterium]|jgi:uncharacterized protein